MACQGQRIVLLFDYLKPTLTRGFFYIQKIFFAFFWFCYCRLNRNIYI